MQILNIQAGLLMPDISDKDLFLRKDIEYWTKGNNQVNFGDYITEYLMRRALTGVENSAAGIYRIIGSVISNEQIIYDLSQLPSGSNLLYWGCGARDRIRIRPENKSRCAFPAVRGPLTRDILELPFDTPMGDPALIIPLIFSPLKKANQCGETLLVPHILDKRSNIEMIGDTGCSKILYPSIDPSPAMLESLIEQICSARFVLAGSLHAAIIACAYNVPFGFWSAGGKIDVPFKWFDFASSINVPAIFVSNVSQGISAYENIILPNMNKPSTLSLIRSAPFDCDFELIDRAQYFDTYGSTPENQSNMEDKGNHMRSMPGANLVIKTEKLVPEMIPECILDNKYCVNIKLQHYLDKNFDHVSGWCYKEAIEILDYLSSLQSTFGVRGNACEIGVYTGKFFIAIAEAVGDRAAIAMDDFDKSYANDGTVKHIFYDNVKNLVSNPGRVTIIEEDCMNYNLKIKHKFSQTLGEVQILSLNRSQTPEYVLNDIMIANDICLDGAIIVVNDILNQSWPGVIEGISRLYIGTRPKFIPLLIGYNKLFLIGIRYHNAFLDRIEDQFPNIFPKIGIKRVKIFGHDLIALV